MILAIIEAPTMSVCSISQLSEIAGDGSPAAKNRQKGSGSVRGPGFEGRVEGDGSWKAISPYLGPALSQSWATLGYSGLLFWASAFGSMLLPPLVHRLVERVRFSLLGKSQTCH